MNTDRLEALLWARIDNTLDPEDLAELEAHLEEHPEPQEIERQIAAIAAELDTMERAQPPAELRSRINDALANATPPVVQPAPIPHPHPQATWRARWLPVAASLLIGVALGYLLHPGTGGSIDTSGVSGTMLTPPAQMEFSPVEIHLEAGAGRIVASRAGADVVVDVFLMTEVELGVTVEGARAPVRFDSLNSTDAAATNVSAENGWVAVRYRGPGTLTFSVSAVEPEDALRLQVSGDSLPVEERWIGPSRIELEP